MYTVFVDNRLFYDPRVKELRLTSGKIGLTVNRVGTFEFTIPPTHPQYSNINKLKSVIEVKYGNTLVFRGRPLNDSKDFDKMMKIVCEGDLAYLNDTKQRPYEYSGSVRGFMELILSRHNSMVVDPNRQFEIGNITVTDPNDYITRADSGFTTTWKVLEEKMLKLLGGYFVIRRVGNVNYLDYLEDSEFMSKQSITLGENLLDISTSRKGQDIFTALIPHGARVKNEESGEETIVDITSVNDGSDFVFNQKAVDRYGWIFHEMTWDNVTEAANLKRKAEAFLGMNLAFQDTLEVKAIDRNMYDGSFDRFRLFEYVRVNSGAHGIDDKFLITKLDIDILNPVNNKLTLGGEVKTMTDKQNNNSNTIETVKNDQDLLSHNITEDLRQLSLTITSTAEKYAREVKEQIMSDVNQTTSEISTQFEQLKDEFLFQFTTILEQVQNIDGETKNKFEEIVKYIRFVDGNIILGEVGNELILEIANDRISFLQSNTEVAYISHNKLFIYDAEVINSLKLGSFAFIPRDNGNLSFRKVVN